MDTPGFTACHATGESLTASDSRTAIEICETESTRERDYAPIADAPTHQGQWLRKADGVHERRSTHGHLSKRRTHWTSFSYTLVFLSSLFLLNNLSPDLLAQSRRSAGDDQFIDDVQRRSFQYFWEQADPQTGLVPDRARIDGTKLDANHQNVASIAATGFGLTGLCIAQQRGWIDQTQARVRTINTLRFFADRAFQKNGWFYHWLDAKTGERRWNSEVSSIDTALLLGGILTVRQCFGADREVTALATRIYDRVDFKWMLNGHSLFLSHGWKPESGFLKPRWNTYSEDTILYILAIGSRTHPISPASWYALWRDRYRYDDYRYFTTIGVPLFMHQYSHAWIDYRNRREARGDRIDYFENSVSATLAHRKFCIDLSYAFPAFGPDMWGITASDSEQGYLAWGGPPIDRNIDGTLVPSAAGGSLMFTPVESTAVLQAMHSKYGAKIYSRYGFVDAFNPKSGWVDRDVIGINVGITLLSAENMRSGAIWKWFMKNTEIPLAMNRIGLVPYRARPIPKRGFASKSEYPKSAKGPVWATGSLSTSNFV